MSRFLEKESHSVKGSGALFAKKGRPLVPFILGGASQSGLRGGSFDLPSLAAFGAAASLATLSWMPWDSKGRVSEISSRLKFKKRVPDVQILFKKYAPFAQYDRSPFPESIPDALHYFLQRKGLRSNTGGAYCQHLHSILASSGIKSESALSFSFSRMTTQDEIIKAAASSAMKSPF